MKITSPKKKPAEPFILENNVGGMPVAAQIEALEAILAEEDGETVALVVQELTTDRERHEKTVRVLAHNKHPRVARRAKEILHSWGVCTCQEFGDLRKHSKDFPGWLRLEELCWTLAQVENSACNIPAGRKKLNALADRVDELAPAHSSDEAFVHALAEILGNQEGFCGNADDFYNPHNSYIDKVLESKLGVPLTLSLIYIFVSQRLGREVYGLNTPGHYLTRCGQIVFDPFNSGIIVPPEQLAIRFQTSLKCWQDPTCFEASPFITAQRMLGNLLRSYDRNGDTERHDRTQNYLRYLEKHCC